MELIGARYVLPISGTPILDGAIAIGGTRIVAVGTQKEIKARYPDAPFRNFDQHVLMPGLINAHSCLDLSLFDPEEIPARLIEWQATSIELRRFQSAVKRRNAILEGLQRALSWGVTTLADTSNYSGLLETARDVGLRLVICPEITGTADVDHQSLFDDTLALVDSIQQLGCKRIRAGISPFAPYALSRHLIKIVTQHARSVGIPITMRAAMSFGEMEFFFESKGEIAEVFFPKMGWKEELPLAQRKTPIQFLESSGVLASHPALIGCTHVSDTDIELLAKSQSKVIHLPSYARHFDLGLAPVNKFRAAGIPVALGTGTLGAPLKQSLWDSLRTALKVHGDVAGEALSAEELLSMATLEAARALGWEQEIGSLAVGKNADFVVIETSGKHPLEQIPLALINETTPDRISKVYVAGEMLK
jgi:cytosine/adenosine deaminase-related metal-dependent hydrolase